MRRNVTTKRRVNLNRAEAEAPRLDDKSVLELISRAPAFAGLPAAGHSYLAEGAVIGTYEPGEVVGGEGTTDGFMFGVAKGRLRGVKFSPEGRRLIFMYMERGVWAGFYWAVDQGRAVMDVEAVEPSVCVKIPGDVLEAAGRKWPRLYEGLYLEVLRRTQKLFALLELNVAHPLRVRVALVLLGLLQGHQRKTPQGIQLDLAINQIELAGLAFCSRQHLNRVLAEWSTKGIVSVVGRKVIIVHDLAALNAEAHTSGF